MIKAQNTSKRTGEMVTISRAEYDKIQDYVSQLEQQNRWLLEQLNIIRHRKFGASSEKSSEEVLEQLSLLFDEAEVYAAAEENQDEEPAEVSVRSYKRKKKVGSARDILPEDVEVVTEEYSLSEEERTCPQCGEQMEVIGTEVQEQLVLIPAKAILRRRVYYVYACKNCEKNDISTPVVRTPLIPAVIPGSFASPEAIAYIMVQKFVMASPLYRQEQEWNRLGIMLSRQTMSNWLLLSTERWLTPIYFALRGRMILCDLLHSDETSLQVLHERGKSAQSKSSMWLYRTSGDAEYAIVLYEYQPGKNGQYPRDFLAGFEGYLQTDGAPSYNSVQHVIHVGCWAHARRNFFDAAKAVGKGKRSSTAEQGLAYCDRLFQLEKRFAKLTPEERKQKRLEQSKPVLDAMLAWAETRHAAPKSTLGKALNYVKNQWEPLTRFLLDGRIELSNNRAERSIKPFVIARKNFLFTNTPRGAQCSAVMFSLIETAKENGLDPYKYLCYVLTQAPILSKTRDDWATLLLPEYAPEECRLPAN